MCYSGIDLQISCPFQICYNISDTAVETIRTQTDKMNFSATMEHTKVDHNSLNKIRGAAKSIESKMQRQPFHSKIRLPTATSVAENLEHYDKNSSKR